jgi:hypothetical protein
MLQKRQFPWIFLAAGACLFLACMGRNLAFGGERQLIQLKDFSQTEVKTGGFTLPHEMKIHIRGLGAGPEKSFTYGKSDLFAYGWIINAVTRELVWKMERSNTSKEKKDRSCELDLTLKGGSYEVYYAAYGYVSGSPFANFSMNIDRRKKYDHGGSKGNGFFGWFDEFFGNDMQKDWDTRSKAWYIEIDVDDRSPEVGFFTVPKEFPNVLFKATKLGENEHVRQQFVLSKSTPVRIYALGEIDNSGHAADYGSIINTKTRKRIWDMAHENTMPAGGAEKNIRFDGAVTFPAGEYTVYFSTDDSHSFVDWNASPPSDPFNYGITLMAVNDKDMGNFKLSSSPTEEQNVIVQLTRVGNDQTRNASFTLKKESAVRVYALGEAANSRHQMADYGWIIDSRTREKVWTMDFDHTEDAGGAEKNRLVDEVVTLPAGSYTVFYRTDDSHSYGDWNAAAPFDPEHWGITLYGEGEKFDASSVDKNSSGASAGIIAQIVKVENNARRTLSFKLSKPTHVRIYAIGEGQNHEMFDYGWIEDAKSGNVMWEMTYSMTFHAGGGRKNRMVNTTLILDKGDYILHFNSDDSHSYNDWNTDPPDDPAMWGITLYDEH